MPKHRVPLLGTGLGRFEDPERSRDPRVSAVVAALKQLPPDALAPAPAADFREELRAQLVAIAPRIIAEEAAGGSVRVADRTPAPAARTTRAADTAREPGSRPARTRSSRGLGRPLRLAGAVLTLFLVLLGGAVWASQRALPGDALYGLKRTGEDVRLAFAGSDTARAKLYLGFAGTRVDEAKALVRRSVSAASALSADARVSAATATLVRQTLGSSDTDIRDATRLLTTDAIRTHSDSGLRTVRRWAPSQLSRLRQLAVMLPPGALRHRAAVSSELVRQAAHRAVQVGASLDRHCAGRAGSDRLGAKPCATAVPPQRTRGHRHARHGRPGPAVSRGPGHPTSSSPATGGGGATGGAPPVGTGGTQTSPAPHQPRHVPTSIPTLPLPLPTPTGSLPSVALPSVSLPVSVGSCGATLPLGITLSTCPGN